MWWKGCVRNGQAVKSSRFHKWLAFAVAFLLSLARTSGLLRFETFHLFLSLLAHAFPSAFAKLCYHYRNSIGGVVAYEKEIGAGLSRDNVLLLLAFAGSSPILQLVAVIAA